MNVFSPAVLTAAALLIVWLTWWIWCQRQAARAHARREAEAAKHTRTMQAISHDLSNLLSVMTVNLQVAQAERPTEDELLRLVDDVSRAATSATKLLEVVRGRQAAAAMGGIRSMEAVVRWMVSLIKRQYPHIELRTSGDFEHRGNIEDAARVIQNLLFNAVREAERAGNATVHVSVEPSSLRISNRVRDPARLDESIWDSGKSHQESSGLGLAIVRETAARLGWKARHEVDGDRITFIVEPESGGYR